VLLIASTVAGCGSSISEQPAAALYVFRADRQVLVQVGADLQPRQETPIPIPESCSLTGMYAAPRGSALALELSCAFGPATLIWSPVTGKFMQPVQDADSHFLAWAPDGQALYLRVNSINRPRIIRQSLDGGRQVLAISEFTYDLAPSPLGEGFLFSFSAGLGQGSETWTAATVGKPVRRLFADPLDYNALARWSPDGKRFAWIKIPDSSTPFTVGELWIADSDGANAKPLARADAGHGFAPAWSPDGKQVAFVYRDNGAEERADQAFSALDSNLHIVEVDTGAERALTSFPSEMVYAPVWQPNGNKIAFAANVDDTMTAYVLDAAQGGIDRISFGPVCCPVWLHQ
jgi:Tol biopolymer transport system component